MASKTINISLDEKLLKEIDKAAKAAFITRSSFIRKALVSYMHEESRLSKLERRVSILERQKQ